MLRQGYLTRCKTRTVFAMAKCKSEYAVDPWIPKCNFYHWARYTSPEDACSIALNCCTGPWGNIAAVASQTLLALNMYCDVSNATHGGPSAVHMYICPTFHLNQIHFIESRLKSEICR